MSNTFSFKRFGLLLKKHTIEHYRGYLLSLIVLIGLLAMSFGSAVFTTRRPLDINMQAINYIILFSLSGTIFTSTIFSNLSDKRSIIASLTLPASALEKYLMGWLYSYVIFQVMFIAVFYGLVFAFSFMGDWPTSSVHYINVFSSTKNLYYSFIMYAMLHAIMIHGAIYFKKKHFIKTASVFFLTGLVIWLVNGKVLKLMVGAGRKITANRPPFSGLPFIENKQDYNVDLSNESMKWIIGVFILLTIIFWCASYFRLKEKQV